MSDTLTNADILRAARERIANPRHFFMGDYAIDARGRNVHPTNPTADRWCARGAIASVSGLTIAPHDAGTGPYRWLDRAVHQLHQPMKTYEVNDKLGHAAILACLDKAADMAEAAGQ